MSTEYNGSPEQKSTIPAALEYLRRGFYSVPIPPGEKGPKSSGWQKLRLGEEDLRRIFGSSSQNIGLLLGDPSGGLVDVDLDCPEAVILAREFLPSTSLISGRKGKPRSHWWYIVPGVKSKKFQDDGGTIGELRSTGGQTVVPPSIHPSGESYSWDEFGEPASIEGEVLIRAVKLLASAALLARHWPAPGSRHNAALAIAGLLHRGGLSEEETKKIIGAAARAAGDEEVDDRIRAVESTVRRLEANQPATGGPTTAGLVGEEVVGRLSKWLELRSAGTTGDFRPIETIDNPDRLARLYLQTRCKHLDGWTLRLHDGNWYRWNGVAYREVPWDELQAGLTQLCREEFDRMSVEAQKKRDRKNEVVRKVTPGILNNIRLALQSRVIVPSDRGLPCWIEREGPWPADEVLAGQNGLFHLSSLANGMSDHLEPTPLYFSPFALDYRIDVFAPRPEEWLRFLRQLWPDDPQCIATLQESMGYCLTPDTRQQKILMLYGPKRSGKSTIGRVMTGLLGQTNVVEPQLSSLKDGFGLQAFLGKTLAIIADARLRGQTDIIIERLLSISGEDYLRFIRQKRAPTQVKVQSYPDGYPTRAYLVSWIARIFNLKNSGSRNP